MPSATLDGLLNESARLFPERPAVVDPDKGQLTYHQLDAASTQICNQLVSNGVQAGDRVGLYLEKSLASVATVFGILKAGAAYVPVDPHAPPVRNAFIFTDCTVRTVVTDRPRADKLRKAGGNGVFAREFAFSTPDGLLSDLVLLQGTEECVPSPVEEPLAYILYTSGSTGKPKGVMHSHHTALSFVDWCSAEFEPVPEDRFSSHAPFHFDLSILDLYVSIKHGAAVILIGEDLGKQPMKLAPVIADQSITVWYSTPSILRLLTEFGHLEDRDLSALRLLFFAGEVFPMKHLAALHKVLPKPRYYNLYGPTETNVCTYHEADRNTLQDRERPLPIGKVCSGDEALVLDAAGEAAGPGEEGELLISGGSVMLGYWNLEEQNRQAFHTGPDGRQWYRTGDIVKEEEDGVFTYLGRRDRMVKRRGYRVELGEIEAALNNHPEIIEAAVMAATNEDGEVRVDAFLSWGSETKASILALKRYCVEKLPSYMIPDHFKILPALPKTSTDKVDYQKLKEHA